jgi:glycosyltransferase involved in cell wall biosynthesis
MARRIDADGHDAVLVAPSMLKHAPEILGKLRTPSTYFAFEPMRMAYDPTPTRSPRGRLIAAGLDPYERLRKRRDRQLIRSAAHVITLSRHIAARLLEIYGVQADVVYLGVDADAFTPDPAVARERSVLSVGALHPLKGHEWVIEAVATLPAPRPPVVICADRGETRDALMTLAAQREVDLTIHQAIAHSELVGLYRRAGVLACAQVREPFGLIALEGMATATPVVAVDEGGLAESITDGETGVLVPRDAHAIGAAIAALLDDPARGAALGAAGRAAVLRDWTWEATTQHLDAILEQRAGEMAPA